MVTGGSPRKFIALALGSRNSTTEETWSAMSAPAVWHGHGVDAVGNRGRGDEAHDRRLLRVPADHHFGVGAFPGHRDDVRARIPDHVHVQRLRADAGTQLVDECLADGADPGFLAPHAATVPADSNCPMLDGLMWNECPLVPRSR